ncbi:hypothetical protein EWB00_010865, partial [Schistosoma japonicum]
ENKVIFMKKFTFLVEMSYMSRILLPNPICRAQTTEMNAMLSQHPMPVVLGVGTVDNVFR